MHEDSERLPRQLAAILYADVVGFSRMTERDEETTYRSVRRCLDIFASVIEAHNGEVMNYAGDAILARFGSAESALICAARAHEAISKENESTPDENKIRFRIGLNLGDIIEDRGDIFGDGVNIAARLEGLARHGGICVSGSFYDAVVMKLPFDYEFMGEQQVKNISKPIRAYHATLKEGATLPKKPTRTSDSRGVSRASKNPFTQKAVYLVAVVLSAIVVLGVILRSGTREVEHSGTEQAQAVEGEKPVIVVLPFDDISEKKDQEHFVDGMTEDIITDLSRLNKLQVLARNTSFRYKGKSVKPQQIFQELKADYMLEGSVRKASGQIRINAQLINTHNGFHVWANRFDRQLIEVFKVQDEVTRAIVEALSLTLTAQEEEQVAHEQTNNIDAYEMYLHGWRLYTQRTKESNLAAQEEFKNAIKLDPTYARSYGSLALATMGSVTAGWSSAPVADSNRALELAKKAVELDKNLPQSYWALGFVHTFRDEHNEARKAVEKAIAIAPSYADGYGLLSLINNKLGRGHEAIKLIKKAMKLNPYYTWDYAYNLGRGYYNIGEYEKAIEHIKLALERNEYVLPPRITLAAAYGALGRKDDGQWEIEQALTVNPELSISQVRKSMAIADEEKMKLFIEHLRAAGMPEE